MGKTRAQFSKERRRKIRSKHQLISLISPPTMLAIPGHLACHSLQDKEPQAFNFLALTSRTPAPSQPIRLHKHARCRAVPQKRGGKKEEEGEEGSNVETAKGIRWISIVSRLLATVSEQRWNMALTFCSIEDRLLFFHLPLIFSTGLPRNAERSIFPPL